jgi:hypothetical protein
MALNTLRSITANINTARVNLLALHEQEFDLAPSRLHHSSSLGWGAPANGITARPTNLQAILSRQCTFLVFSISSPAVVGIILISPWLGQLACSHCLKRLRRCIAIRQH